MEKVSCLELTVPEREIAWEHLGQLVDDIRPIFFVRTSAGGLSLDDLIDKLKKEGGAIFPVRASRRPTGSFHPQLPTFGPELRVTIDEIKFDEFAICPHTGSFYGDADSDGVVQPKAKPGVYKGSWDTIINTIRDREMEFVLSFQKDARVGIYVGLDAPRMKVKSGMFCTQIY
jgi:hypothetical protein